MSDTNERFDFTSNVDAVLNAESLIRLKPVAPVLDASGLIQIIQAMARKIDQQENEIVRQREMLDSLVGEVASLRVNTEESQALRRDMKRMVNEVETLNVQQRLQSQRVDRLRADLDDVASEKPSTAATGNDAFSPTRLAGSGVFGSSLHRTPSSSQKVVNQQRPVAGLDLVDTPHGLRVQSVKPGGPAALAGFQPNDVIIAVNSDECTTRHQFLDIMEHSSIGQPQDVTYFRDGQRKMTRLYLVSGAVESRTPR